MSSALQSIAQIYLCSFCFGQFCFHLEPTTWAGRARYSETLLQVSHLSLIWEIIFKDVTYEDCVHFIWWRKWTVFRFVSLGFVLFWGEPSERSWSHFPVGGAQTQKLGFVSSYFQLSPVWAYLLLPAQEAPCCPCCCRRTTWKRQHDENWKLTFLKSTTCLLCPALLFSSFRWRHRLLPKCSWSFHILRNGTEELGPHQDANPLTFLHLHF